MIKLLNKNGEKTNFKTIRRGRHHGDILLLWFLIIVALILKRFWYYWSTLI
jgi:hypothetical protein